MHFIDLLSIWCKLCRAFQTDKYQKSKRSTISIAIESIPLNNDCSNDFPICQYVRCVFYSDGIKVYIDSLWL